jgi:hypothetical protein
VVAEVTQLTLAEVAQPLEQRGAPAVGGGADERPAVTTAHRADQPRAAQGPEGLPHGHGRDPEPVRELGLRRERQVVRQYAETDGVTEPAGDDLGASGGLEGREDGGIGPDPHGEVSHVRLRSFRTTSGLAMPTRDESRRSGRGVLHPKHMVP